MEINSAFDQRAAVHAARLDWTPSPTRGVERRMLDRIGGEVARATSLVRYAPGSRFAPHTHGGFEALVLDGAFSESGETFTYQSWLRLPPSAALEARTGKRGAKVWIKTGHLMRRQQAPPRPASTAG